MDPAENAASNGSFGKPSTIPGYGCANDETRQMDPNVALENILRGYEVADHATALGEWLAREGFAPHCMKIPDECAPFIARHCARHYRDVERSTIRVRADKAGLWAAPTEGPWMPLAIWPELLHMED